MGKLDNKVAIVTGGSRGSGRRRRWRWLTRSRRRDQLLVLGGSGQGRGRRPGGEGVRAAAFQADQSDAVQAAGLIHSVVQQFGKLDILVNNAGVTVGGPIDSELADESAFDRQLAINYTSVVAAVRAAFPLLPDGGRIVSISSGVGTRVGFPEWPTTRAPSRPSRATVGAPPAI
ncbi:SDR family NAD(P)-dependent oxidoreductase [Streptomyces sp. M10(2022)]